MFSQTTEYALRAMSWLALTPNELVSTVSLAEHTRVPAHYLAKVLQQLAAAGLIQGRRGVHGGYKLAKPASQIRLFDVLTTVGSLQRIKTCPMGLVNHGPNLCPLHRMMDSVAKSAIDILGDKTLEDLVNDPLANKPLCDADTTAKLTVALGGNSKR